jgi:hypothetical protein
MARTESLENLNWNEQDVPHLKIAQEPSLPSNRNIQTNSSLFGRNSFVFLPLV